jgi:hypothetical protein
MLIQISGNSRAPSLLFHSRAATDHGDLKTISHILVACGLCYLALIALFIALLALSLSLSSGSRIESRLRFAIESGLLTKSLSPLSPYGHFETDMWSECLAFAWNLSNDDLPTIYRIAAGVTPLPEARIKPTRISSCALLVDAITEGKAPAPNGPYLRFWHGHEAYLRPMLMVMSLGSLHRMNAILLFAAFSLFGYQLARHFGTLTWPILVIPFAWIGDLLTAPLVTVHSLHLTWTFLSVAVVAVVLQRWDNENPVILPTTMFAIGAIANFVSNLINPPLAPTLIGFLVLAKYLSRASPHRVLYATLNAVIIMLLWFAGYALAWIAKWLLAALVLGIEPTMTEVLAGISFSAYDTREFARTLPILQPTWFVLSHGPPHLLALIAAAWAIAGWGIVRSRLTKSELIDFLLLQLPLLVPIVWVEIMRTHSVHHPYVYRDFLPLSILPLLAALMLVKKRGLLNIAGFSLPVAERC